MEGIDFAGLDWCSVAYSKSHCSSERTDQMNQPIEQLVSFASRAYGQQLIRWVGCSEARKGKMDAIELVAAEREVDWLLLMQSQS